MPTARKRLRDVIAPSSRQTLLAAMASLFGWGLDLFDLFILLYVAPVVGKLFFPAESRCFRSRAPTHPSRSRC